MTRDLVVVNAFGAITHSGQSAPDEPGDPARVPGDLH
jgi:hypothetical protein